MSGQSDKKSRKNNQQSNKILLLAIAICLGINLSITLLKYFIKGTPITTKQIMFGPIDQWTIIHTNKWINKENNRTNHKGI